MSFDGLTVFGRGDGTSIAIVMLSSVPFEAFSRTAGTFSILIVFSLLG